MASLNRATILGNVGRDPEIRSTQSGNRCANLSIATTETWKDRASGERKEKTEWHKITVWGDGLVDVIERYVIKGSHILVEGQIQTRKWQDQSGQDKYSTEIVLQGPTARLLLLGGRIGGDDDRSGGPEPKPQTPARAATPAPEFDDSDIPF